MLRRRLPDLVLASCLAAAASALTFTPTPARAVPAPDAVPFFEILAARAERESLEGLIAEFLPPV